MRVSWKRPVARRGRMMVWNASSSTTTRQTMPAIRANVRMNGFPPLGRLEAGRSSTIPCILAFGAAMNELGKALLGLGLLLAVIGAVLLLAGRFGLPLGRLPGDFAWRGKNASFYFPLGTS